MALSVSFRETFKINAQLVSEFFLVEKYMIKTLQFVIDQLNYEKLNLYLYPKKYKLFLQHRLISNREAWCPQKTTLLILFIPQKKFQLFYGQKP